MSQSFRTLDRLVDSLGEEQLVSPYIERALLQHDLTTILQFVNTPNERRDDNLYHPSSDAVADPLYLFYKFHPRYKLKDKQWTTSNALALLIGNAIHIAVENLLSDLEMTNSAECEVPFYSEEKKCTGTLDVRRCWLPNGLVVPVDVKSTTRIPKQLDYDYMCQMQVYMDLGCGGAEKGSVLYVQKPTPHKVKDFVVTRDEYVLSQIYSKWEMVNKAIAEDDPSGLATCCKRGSSTHHGCLAEAVCDRHPPLTPTEVS